MRNPLGSKNILGNLSASLSRLSEAIVPPTCLVCDARVASQGGCCPDCWKELRFVAPPICPVMGSPFEIDLGEGVLSGEALQNPPPFERLRAVVLYDDMARKLVSLIKFSDRTDLIRWLAVWMNAAGSELIGDADLVVPIALHPKRLRQRKFNQAAELSRYVCKLSDKPYAPHVLVRHKNTRQQVGLSESERQRNLTGAFRVSDAGKLELKGKRVLLLDDVYTTGATAKAATRALKRAGADAVDVLVFAKVENHINLQDCGVIGTLN